jgi:hypothetical protein
MNKEMVSAAKGLDLGCPTWITDDGEEHRQKSCVGIFDYGNAISSCLALEKR